MLFESLMQEMKKIYPPDFESFQFFIHMRLETCGTFRSQRLEGGKSDESNQPPSEHARARRPHHGVRAAQAEGAPLPLCAGGAGGGAGRPDGGPGGHAGVGGAEAGGAGDPGPH